MAQGYPFGDFRWLLYLAERQNISAVADELHIPQPTLSRNLAQLEAALEVQLFDRVGKRIILNSAGKIAYEHLRRVQAELSTATSRIRDTRSPRTTSVALGFLHSFGTALVPAIAQDFRLISPYTSLFLTQGPALELEKLVISGSLDVALSSPKPASPKVKWNYIFSQDLALIVPPGHRLSHRKEVDIREVGSDPFIVMHEGYGLRTIVENIFQEAHFRPHITMEMSDIATITGFVQANMGISIVPLEASTGLAHYVGLAHVAAAREVGVMYSLERDLTYQAAELVNFISAHAARLARVKTPN